MTRCNFAWYKLPIFAVLHALFWLPTTYLVAISKDHISPVVPYVSALGIYPPEKYMFMILMSSYGMMATVSQWIWCWKASRKIRKLKRSIILHFMCTVVVVVLTVAGISIVGLSLINTKDNNAGHYHLTLVNFTCHVIAIPLGAIIIACISNKWIFYCFGRLFVVIQMMLASASFVHFNQIGLRVLNAKDFFYIKPHESGYIEFVWSAVSEWCVVLGCVEITFITALELHDFEKSDSNLKQITNFNV
ncbi:prokaryotic DNA topoisomerase [Schistosoma japonicum]|nr:prokaryotic DNA topoisomerase [Schistosoma japonicum]KAH8850883.1 prokaryotic DNA topoisomerase [Schistosoma japonicum]KAH8850884.1 prokaryotic DNA topoisomerase [Schistosoma japonicum]